ncbi:MAG: hypothetical protein KF847_18500 [Pirellulales bacterium]|nr:hypothetical protein [Pirellulales bacterium]
MDDSQRAQMRDLWHKLSPIFEKALNCGPPEDIDQSLLDANWPERLPYLDWDEARGGLPLCMSNEGDLCVPVKAGAKLPAGVAEHLVYSTAYIGGVREDQPLLRRDSPPLADYRRVCQYRDHLKWYEGKLQWDAVFDAIADPDNPEPIPRKLLIQRPEMAAWLNGELSTYSATMAEYKILWPAFIERRRRLRERGLAGGNHERNGTYDAQRRDIELGNREFIERLLAGPVDGELSARELALLEAHLAQPVSLATIQREKQATGESATNAQRNKLKQIRDFNRNLQDAATGEGADAGETETPPAPKNGDGDDGDGNRYARLASLQPAHRKAYLSFLYAEALRETRLNDRDAWDCLNEFGVQYAGQSELQEYDLPVFATWSRYLRVARKSLDERKYTPRSGRQPSA